MKTKTQESSGKHHRRTLLHNMFCINMLSAQLCKLQVVTHISITLHNTYVYIILKYTATVNSYSINIYFVCLILCLYYSQLLLQEKKVL